MRQPDSHPTLGQADLSGLRAWQGINLAPRGETTCVLPTGRMVLPVDQTLKEVLLCPTF